ncbi:hypothetical protein [Chryseobacterium limigenitum]|uniref:Uncharacterized protein n=1 Tax=Chryseobacterium limigenitum TaxID=1612149 RepID=A0A1K2ICG3_9FLAO|nr:hypothetical protein [Chryseobacterium limigenitum]SFZ90089.1 hypothetical protein SAMN05216324_101205 [Chryseobacterium limigenitum]
MSTIKIDGDFIRVEAVLADISNNNPFNFRRAEIINIEEPEKSLKGIVINVSNDNLGSPCITPGIENITYNFMFKNDLNWKSGDYVRISFLNEVDYREFDRLLPYFEARLRKFGYDPTDEQTFSDYSKAWCKVKPAMLIDDICKDALVPIPRQTQDGGVVRVEELP